MSLNLDRAGNVIQIMPIVEGLVGLTEGTIGNITMIHCVANGGFNLTFPSSTVKAITMTAGQQRTVAKGSTVAITSGTFDFA